MPSASRPRKQLLPTSLLRADASSPAAAVSVRAGAPKTGDAPTRPSRVEPLLAARGFFGMVIYHHLIQELFGGRRYQKFDHRRVSATLTQIWFDGMVAASG